MTDTKQTNKYIQISEPWALAKAINEEVDSKIAAQLRSEINSIIYHCAEATRIVGILLQPYIPAKAAQLLDMLGVDESKRTFDDARFGADYDYGVPKDALGRDAWDGLFPPLPVDT
jgi:methionyl-tRNA synthetase